MWYCWRLNIMIMFCLSQTLQSTSKFDTSVAFVLYLSVRLCISCVYIVFIVNYRSVILVWYCWRLNIMIMFCLSQTLQSTSKFDTSVAFVLYWSVLIVHIMCLFWFIVNYRSVIHVWYCWRLNYHDECSACLKFCTILFNLGNRKNYFWFHDVLHTAWCLYFLC